MVKRARILGPLCVELACSVCACVGFLQCFGFLIFVSLIVASKLAVGVDGGVLCLCLLGYAAVGMVKKLDG